MVVHIHRKVEESFASLTPTKTLVFCSVTLLILGWLDIITGDYSLIVFYLLPVSIAAWFVSKWCGLLFCMLAIVVRIFTDEWSRPFLFTHSILHYWNELIEFLFLIIMSLLCSALKQNLENEKELACRDPLTNTLNRRSFFELAERELNKSQRYNQSFTVAYIDVDNFKGINEQLGHQIADELLITVVATIRSVARSYDILSRFGGDEFVMLLPDTCAETAHTVLQNIHEHLDTAMACKGWMVTFSIGLVTYLNVPSTTDEVLRCADEVMHTAKKYGKNRLFHKVMEGDTHGQREL